MNNTILVVEDDKNTGFLLEKRLKEEGFDVVICTDGKQALDAFEPHAFCLCILDVMLPSKDGLELGRDIREEDDTTPVIFLTARNLKSDKVRGYKTGCDDYITKPFDVDELVFKIRAILKRSVRKQPLENKITVSDLTLHRDERLIVTGDKTTTVSHKELLLLDLFFSHFNEVIPRKELLMKCWGNDDYFSSKILDVYLTKVRKILKLDEKLRLQNIHGHGYKLVASK
ncbi:MAG: response regulator transcription factor [Bacteroidia bacterium]|nr:response regulator transcription factor [Bacteroidia bacterium]